MPETGFAVPLSSSMALPDDPDALLLLHNPRCSKSRAVRAILVERGEAFRERLYLDEPLSRAELADLRGRLSLPVPDWLRSGETVFRETGLAPDADEERLLDAMAQHPILMERPILVRGPRAVVGRPPERVLGLLDR